MLVLVINDTSFGLRDATASQAKADEAIPGKKATPTSMLKVLHQSRTRTLTASLV